MTTIEAKRKLTTRELARAPPRRAGHTRDGEGADISSRTGTKAETLPHGGGRRKLWIADATMRPVPLSIYIHIPFCTVRCAYCDFNTYAGPEAEAAEVHTVFFGGGTPSLLPPDLIEAILRAVHGAFRLADSCEISLEANPGTLGRQDLEGRRRAGVTRLSLGAQSAQPAELRLLDRAHTFDDVAAAVRQARPAGLAHPNPPPISGLPPAG